MMTFKNQNRNVIAIIPARGGSKGIPGKNIMNFCGKPLIGWTIEQALASQHIKEVYVSTDCKEIAQIARLHGAGVIKRPRALSTDTASSEEAILHAISDIEKHYKIDTVVFLQATSPVRETCDIDNALLKFFSEKADSLFSAAILDDFCAWEVKNNILRSLTFDYNNRGTRQDRKQFYLENGSIYIFKPEVLKRYNNRIGGKIIFYSMPFWKSFEIDKLEDVEICEYFMKKRILNARKGHDTILPKDIELIVYDFDGVLTNNKVLITEDGREAVSVNRGDGLIIRLFREKGLKQLILTTETNKVVMARARKLNIPVLRGVKDKKKNLTAYCSKHNIDLENVIYIGNDINDYEIMRIVGYSACPSDASEEIKRISDVILNVNGGEGVVRELARHLNII